MGEPEELLAELTGNWDRLDRPVTVAMNGEIVTGAPHYADMQKLPALRWMHGLHRQTPSPPPSLRRGTNGTRSGSGGLARMPVPLHVLREGKFPE